MAVGDLRGAITRVEMFANLDPGAVDALIQAGATFKYGPGSTIVAQGAAGGGFQLFVEGSGSVVIDGEVRRSLGEGDYFGEMSLFDDSPRSATVLAGPEGAKTFAVSPVSFGTVIDQYPGSARSVLRLLAQRLREAEARGREQHGPS